MLTISRFPFVLSVVPSSIVPACGRTFLVRSDRAFLGNMVAPSVSSRSCLPQLLSRACLPLGSRAFPDHTLASPVIPSSDHTILSFLSRGFRDQTFLMTTLRLHAGVRDFIVLGT